MNMAGMNPVAAGGPVGGGMMTMNNNNNIMPMNQHNQINSVDSIKAQLNTYIYEYLLRLGHFDIARSLLREEKFELRTKPPVKQSPGRRKDGEVNGVDGDNMEMDMKDDIPDDLPRPINMSDSGPQGSGFLLEWFSIFFDLYSAHRSSSKMQGGNGGPAAQYLMQHQNMQRLRETQQANGITRMGMVNPNQFAVRNARPGMANGAMQRPDMTKTLTPQQMQVMHQQQQAKQAQMLQAQQAQMQREAADMDMVGRPGTPADGDNGGSPSKRPRLEGQQFAGGQMPNGRPGMPGMAPQGMMIQNAFNPNMNQAQFRQNGAMPPKAVQAGMANGMMMTAASGSPMMQGQNPQFMDNMSMELYSQRMAGQQMQGAPGAQSGNHALQDYQMQLMLLEQQNKKRLLMARQEQDNISGRDVGPLPGGLAMQTAAMSPHSGTSPIGQDQMKRTPQLGGLTGSPSGADGMQGRSPAAMNFMNGVPGGPQGDFSQFMKENPGVLGPGQVMRPPTSMEMNGVARQQVRPGQPFPGGQPMIQQPSQGQPQPMGTPGQRNEMAPPPAPANSNAQRNQPSSPQSTNAPPTPSQASKPNPKKKNAKEDANKKRPAKKNSTANAPSTDNESSATATAAEAIAPVHPNFATGNKGPNANMASGAQTQNQTLGMQPSQPQLQQNDLSQQNAFSEFDAPDQNFNLDFSTLDNAGVLENFDFDSFLNTTEEFAFDGGLGGVGDFGLDTSAD